ncbi:hypothetical protein QFZ64_003112 [Streptomyces sp. B3I8]|nr:hypothetical protein [Streptomyces sp. B3I8]
MESVLRSCLDGFSGCLDGFSGYLADCFGYLAGCFGYFVGFLPVTPMYTNSARLGLSSAALTPQDWGPF